MGAVGSRPFPWHYPDEDAPAGYRLRSDEAGRCDGEEIGEGVTLSREEYERFRREKPGMYPAIDFDSPRHLVPDTQREPPPVDEPVAEVSREAPRQGRVRICVTSYRLRLADDDNLALGAKPLVDACVAAGMLPADSPIWCKIEHRQEQVKNAAEERTEITLENL